MNKRFSARRVVSGVLGALLVVSGLMRADVASAQGGFVTPTELEIEFTKIGLLGADGESEFQLASGSFPVTFRKSDPDFAKAKFEDIFVPEGRYSGVTFCANFIRQMKIQGERYTGTAGAGLANDGFLCSAAGNTLSIVTAANQCPDPAVIQIGIDEVGCDQTRFPRVVCVTSDSSKCQAGDEVIEAPTTAPDIYMLLDLYHAAHIDASGASPVVAESSPIYPIATVGQPGVGLHLGFFNGTNEPASITVLFGSNAQPEYADHQGGFGGMDGFCAGEGYTSDVTSAPAGKTIFDGGTPVMAYNSDTGKLQIAVRMGPTPQGVSVLNDINVAAGATVNVSCIDDSTAEPPFLGYTYPGGSGVANSSNFTLQRIVDPKNLLGTCATGSCGAYPTSAP